MYPSTGHSARGISEASSFSAVRLASRAAPKPAGTASRSRSAIRPPAGSDPPRALLRPSDHRTVLVDKLRYRFPSFEETINHTLSFLLGRLGGFASSRFFGSRRSADGSPGVRRSGLGEADTRLITVGELDAGGL